MGLGEFMLFSICSFWWFIFTHLTFLCYVLFSVPVSLPNCYHSNRRAAQPRNAHTPRGRPLSSFSEGRNTRKRREIREYVENIKKEKQPPPLFTAHCYLWARSSALRPAGGAVRQVELWGCMSVLCHRAAGLQQPPVCWVTASALTFVHKFSWMETCMLVECHLTDLLLCMNTTLTSWKCWKITAGFMAREFASRGSLERGVGSQRVLVHWRKTKRTVLRTRQNPPPKKTSSSDSLW